MQTGGCALLYLHSRLRALLYLHSRLRALLLLHSRLRALLFLHSQLWALLYFHTLFLARELLAWFLILTFRFLSGLIYS